MGNALRAKTVFFCCFVNSFSHSTGLRQTMDITIFIKVGVSLLGICILYLVWKLVVLIVSVAYRGYQLRHIPGPPSKSLIFGNRLDMKDFIHRKFPEYAQQYGKVIITSSSPKIIDPNHVWGRYSR